MERHLSRNGTLVLKFFLNISKKEQKKRFMDCIENPDKHWKFEMGDLHERAVWDEYQDAFEDTLTHTSTDWAPWWVIPSDNKWVSRALVSAILTEAIQGLGLKPRRITEAQWPSWPKRANNCSRKRSPDMRVPGLVSLLALATALLGTSEGLPAGAEQLRELLTRQLSLTDAQVDTVRRGEPVAVLLETTVSSEIAIGGAVRIDAPASRLVAVVQDIERLEQGGGFLATRKFSSPPVEADMAAFRLPDEDIASLRTCQPGRCDVKLGQRALQAAAAIDWNASSAAPRPIGS